MSFTNVSNFVLFQAGWLVTCLAAAHAMPMVGPVFISIWLVWHFWRLKGSRRSEALLLGVSAVTGSLVDSALVLGGAISFPPQAVLGSPTTLWMVFLWMGFAATLNHSMGWLRGRYLLAAVIGFVGGPLAYLAGDRLGAIETTSSWPGLLVIALLWSLVVVLLLRLAVLTQRRVAVHPGVDQPITRPPARAESR